MVKNKKRYYKGYITLQQSQKGKKNHYKIHFTSEHNSDLITFIKYGSTNFPALVEQIKTELKERGVILVKINKIYNEKGDLIHKED